MKTVLIADINKRLLEDIENRAFIQDFDNINICTTDQIDNLQEEIKSYGAQELIISASLLQNLPSWNGLGIPVRCYAYNQKDLGSAVSAGVLCMGIMDTSDRILDAVISGKIENTASYASSAGSHEDRLKQTETGPGHGNIPNPSGSVNPEPYSGYRENAVSGNIPRPARNEAFHGASPMAEQSRPQESQPPYREWQDRPPAENWNPQGYWQRQDSPEQSQDGYPGNTGNYPGQQTGTGYPYGNNPYTPYGYGKQDDGQYFQERRMETPPSGTEIREHAPDPYSRERQGYYQDARNPGGQYNNWNSPGEKEYRVNERYVAPGPGYMKGQTYNREAYMAVEKDMGNIKSPTKVITVYSAKGGVGKTTIACELATYLALTKHGRDNLKVCIADFNIDFGDVIATLPFDPERVTMSLWAADIRSRIASGEAPESIRYSESEITGKWLQRNDRDGLYALIAPLTNEDSYEISETEQQVMLNNLIHYGGFDYVICDTGNNTRDSSFLCITSADIILLVVTQNVATANSNAGVLNTFGSLGINLDNVRLVINQVKPAKQVSVSAVELEEVFVNPNTGQPYPCAAQIRDSNDVISAGNMREPLVYKSGHEYTRCIGQIAAGIIGDTFVLDSPKKKKLFSFLRKKQS